MGSRKTCKLGFHFHISLADVYLFVLTADCRDDSADAGWTMDRDACQVGKLGTHRRVALALSEGSPEDLDVGACG